MALQVPDEALALILDAEGLDQPSKWPGGSSGITIGVGYDLGFVTEDQFEEDWSPFLSGDDIDRLKDVIGLSGDKASHRASEFGDIKIKRPDAEQVFKERTLPLYSQRTENALPGVDQLPAAAQGALVSLVFNRGGGMKDDPSRPGDETRREMRAIRDAVAAGDLQEIADQLRSMKRLWEGKGLDGLLKRRDAEADLVESAIED
jgi:GH24 family phage-related lysozyme (muramidase)